MGTTKRFTITCDMELIGFGPTWSRYLELVILSIGPLHFTLDYGGEVEHD